MSQAHDYDYLIVGSGFGGSVSALRLAEKGYRVAVLESGRRFEDDDFAERLSQLRRTIFAPKLGLKGILRVTPFKDVMVLSGSGVGGGSLVYAQTLWRAGDEFFQDWRAVCGDAPDLEKYYELAEGMLGVVTQPRRTPADEAIEAIAVELGVADTFRPVPVGVYFGEPGVVHADPYFGGAGPARSGCIECGLCLLGCRNNAKNTLPKNYLWFAERLGVRIDAERTVISIRPLGAADGSDGYAVTSERTGSWIRKDRRTQTARGVVVAGGALGTNQLLAQCKRDGDHTGRPRMGSKRFDHLERAPHRGQPRRSRYLRAGRQHNGPDVHIADRRWHQNHPAAEAAGPDLQAPDSLCPRDQSAWLVTTLAHHRRHADHRHIAVAGAQAADTRPTAAAHHPPRSGPPDAYFPAGGQ
jgi:choline dehydrogenase-like flavoprotein